MCKREKSYNIEYLGTLTLIKPNKTGPSRGISIKKSYNIRYLRKLPYKKPNNIGYLKKELAFFYLLAYNVF